MKRILIFLLLTVLTNAYAQTNIFGRLSGHSKKATEQDSQQSGNTQKSTRLGIPVSLDIGIDTKDVPMPAPGRNAFDHSEAYRMGIQQDVRRDKYRNKDATKYLTKAVEDNNAERVGKLLEAGASAYIDYSMIDKKQYEIMDLMHKNNPMLIRYSQLIHHACAHSDMEMVDFLIDRGASLDLCGNYFEKVKDSYWGWVAKKSCEWNKDSSYEYTPQDVALLYGNKGVVNAIIEKYDKYPTSFGFVEYLYRRIIQYEEGRKGVLEWMIRVIKEEKLPTSKDNSSIQEILNTPFVSIWGQGNSYYTHLFTYEYLLSRAIEQLANYRKRAKSNPEKEQEAVLWENLVKLMIEKGADVNATSGGGSVRGSSALKYEPTIFQTPLLAALKEPGMLDIVKLLLDKGASKSIKINRDGKDYTISVTEAPIHDEYKELFMIGEL